MSTVGFLLLKNSPDFDEQELLKAVKGFHYDIPSEEKHKIKLRHFNSTNKNIYRGFFPFLDNDISHKEFYDLGRPYDQQDPVERETYPMYEPTPWVNDPEGKHTWIIETLDKYFKKMFDVAT